jgi:hypothetical protein
MIMCYGSYLLAGVMHQAFAMEWRSLKKNTTKVEDKKEDDSVQEAPKDPNQVEYA